MFPAIQDQAGFWVSETKVQLPNKMMQLGLSILPSSLGRQGHLVPVFIVRSNHACRYLAEWVSLLKATVQKAFLAAKAFLQYHWFKGSRLFTFRESKYLGYLPQESKWDPLG